MTGTVLQDPAPNGSARPERGPGGPSVKDSVLMVGTVVDLELRQRVRSVAWYVLLGVAALVLAAVTLLLLATAGAFGGEGGDQVVSVVVYLVLLLGTLVTPALSGAAVNGDRDAGTLATTQITLVGTWQLLLGKFLAAWTAALAFLAVASPFLLIALVAGGVDLGVVLTALAVTVLELGVIAAVGVGLSAVIPRPIFSVVTTYLVVAALSVGTLIAFGLAGLAFPRTVTSTYTPYSQSSYDDQGNVVNPVCDAPQVSTSQSPTYDRVWWMLAANPYVVLADATPSRWSPEGYPDDSFTSVKAGVRSLQIVQPTEQVTDECNPSNDRPAAQPSQRQIVEQTVPTWFVGLAIHLVLGALCLLAGARALRTPARRLAKGSRIA